MRPKRRGAAVYTKLPFGNKEKVQIMQTISTQVVSVNSYKYDIITIKLFIPYSGLFSKCWFCIVEHHTIILPQYVQRNILQTSCTNNINTFWACHTKFAPTKITRYTVSLSIFVHRKSDLTKFSIQRRSPNTSQSHRKSLVPNQFNLNHYRAISIVTPLKVNFSGLKLPR